MSTSTLTQSQKNDFVYWTTQYIKRKCLGAKIRQTDLDDGIQLDWKWGGPTSTSSPRKVFLGFADMLTALNLGAEAIKKVIQLRVQKELPELYPTEDKPEDMLLRAAGLK